MAEIPVGGNAAVPEGLDLLGPGDHACLIHEPEADPLPTIAAFLAFGAEADCRAVVAVDAGAVARLRDLSAGKAGGELQATDPPVSADEIGALHAGREVPPLGRARVVVDMNRLATRDRGEALRAEAALQRLVDEDRACVLCVYERRPERAGLLLDVARVHPVVVSGGVVGRNEGCTSPADLLEAWDTNGELDDALAGLRHRPLTGEEPSPDAPGPPVRGREVIVRDAELTITYVNEAVASRVGARREELIGGTDFDLWPEPIARRRRAAARRVTESGEPEVETRHLRDARGGIRAVRVVRKPLLDERGEPKSMMETREPDEDEPARRPRRACNGSARLELTPDGTVVEWDEGARDLYLYRAEDMLGRPFTYLLPPYARADGRELLAAAAAGKAVTGERFLHVTRYGDTVPLKLSIGPLSADDGALFGLEVRAKAVEREAGAGPTEEEPGDRVPLTDAVPDFTYVYDTGSAELSYVSPWAPLVLGLRQADLPPSDGPVFVGEVHPDDAGRVTEAQAELSAGRTRQCTVEYRIAAGGGRHLPVRERRTGFPAGNGRPASIVGEVWVLDDHGYGRAVFGQATPHIPQDDDSRCRVLVKDSDLNYAWANRAWAESVGLEAAELIGKTDFYIYPEALARSFREDDRRFLGNEDGPSFTADSVFKDSKGRMWDRHKVRLRGPDGRTHGLLVANVDVTDQRPEALLPHWAAVINATEDAVMVLTPDGSVVSWNPGAEKTFGYSAREARGYGFLSMVARPFREEMRDVFRRVRDGNSVAHHQTLQLTREGREIEMDLTLSPIVSAAGEVGGISVIARDTTASRQMERALVGSRQSLRTVLESVRDVVYQIDLERREFSYVSPSVEELLGYTGTEVMAMGPDEMFKRVKPEDADRLARLTRHLLEDRRRPRREPRLEYRLRTREGRIVWVSDNRQLLRDESDKPTAIVGSLRDITGRKEAQVELESFAWESPPQFGPGSARIIYKDSELRFVWVNETAAEAMGIKPKDVAGKTDFDFWPPELAEQFQAEDRVVLDSGEPRVYTRTDEYGDGLHVCWEVRKTPRVDADGEVTGLLVIMTDVTAQRAAATRLAQWDSLVSASGDAIIGLSCNGTVLNCNAGAKAMFGRRAGELVGRPLPDVAVPEAREELEQSIARAADGQTVRDFEVPFRRWESELVYVALSMSPIAGPDGGVVAISVTGRDVTARRRAEKALRENAAPEAAVTTSWTPDVILKDRDLRFVWVNESAAENLGHSPEDLVGKTDFDIFPAENAKAQQKFDSQTMREGKPHGGRYTNPRGETWEILKVPLIEADGEVGGLLVVNTNVTARVKAETKMSHWASVVAASRAVIMGLSIDGHILSWNPGAENVFGYSASEMTGRSIEELAAPAQRDELMQNLAAVAQGMPVTDYEVACQTKTGREVHVSITMSPITGAGGDVTGISAIARDITARKRAERELRATERRFRTVLETIRDIAFKYDHRTDTYDYISPSVEDIYGFTPAEMASGGAEANYARIHPDDVERVRESTESLLAEGSEAILEFRYRHKDGHYVWVNESRHVLRDENGDPLSIVGLTRDITPRKQAEETLSKTAGNVRELLDKVPEQVFIKGRDLRFIYVNRATARFYGREPEDIVGKTDHFLYPDDPETARRCREDDRAVLRSGEARHYEERPAGEGDAAGEGLLLWDKIPIKDDEGRVVALVGVQNWEAGHRTVEDLLTHWASIVLASDDAIIGMTVEGEILSWNPGAERMTGYDAGEVHGQSAETIIPAERLEEYRKILARTAGGESVVNHEARLVRKDGRERKVSFTLSPIVGSSGEVQAISCIARDITEREHLETRMRQAQKLESLGILAGGVAHDFNNLLTGILGNASLALMDLAEGSPARYSIERVQQSAQHAAELAGRMLAYSGKGQLAVEPIHFSRLVKEVKGLIEAAVGRHVTVKFDLAEDLPVLQGDPAQMKQVLLNLVTNASEAIGHGPGVISVQTRVARPDAQFFTQAYLHGQADAESYVLLRVSDTGPGMDAETAEQIFDPFFSTKFTGRGLGLAALLGIVRGHNGSIRVKSRPGEGTTFEVLLPGEQLEPAVELPTVDRDAEAASRTILVVDDQENVREVARQMLGRLGYDTLTAATGRQAVELAREHDNKIAAVLLDLTMPEMEGPETLERLRQIRPRLPVLVASGYNESEIASRFEQEKPDGFIRKPFTAKQLQQAFAALLARGE